MNGKILITGAAGFIGSNLSRRLLDQGREVIGVDNLSQGFHRNIAELLHHPRFMFLEKDVRDAELGAALPQRLAAIVHLAAFKIPRYGNALDTLLVNMLGTENILKLALQKEAKFIFASTSDTYGKNPQLPFSESHSDFYLGDPQVKRWSYAASKIYDEHLIHAYNEEKGLPFVILRYFGGYGPRQHLDWWGGPQSVFIARALRRQPLTVHGDGQQTRSFTFVEDMVEGTQRAIFSPQAEGKVLNLGHVEEITILNLAEMIWRMINPGSSPQIEFISYRAFSGAYEDVRRRIPDVARIRQVLEFSPRISLEQGLPPTIAWQKEVMTQEGLLG